MEKVVLNKVVCFRMLVRQEVDVEVPESSVLPMLGPNISTPAVPHRAVISSTYFF